MTNNPNEDASLDFNDIPELTSQLRAIFSIQDRKYGVPSRIYEKCFVGSEAVTAMLENGFAGDVSDAVNIGNVLITEGVFHHVLKEHEFKNGKLFYRFATDEDGGQVARNADGSAVSWAKFLPSLGCEKQQVSLQPNIPALDPDLGEFEQVDIEALGVSPLDEHNVKLLDCVHPKGWINPAPKKKYNLVVVGAGAGGLITSAGAAGMGAEVALIESHLLGGDCLNVGCVPSKALISAANVAASARRAGDFGVNISGDIEVDFGKVMERMRNLRASIAPVDSAKRFSEELGVNVFLGRAKFTGKDTVEVGGETLRFGKAVIATGGTAAVPPIEGLSEAPYLTNASVFNLTELPGSMGVIGAGPIGMELAQAFQRFGSEVTVFSRQNGILPKEDPDAAKIVEDSMRTDGVNFILQASYVRIESSGSDGPVTVVYSDSNGAEQSITFDALLVATGRKPNVMGLGLEDAGVEFDPRKGINVNDKLQSSNPNIFAVGDVATKFQFTHVADFMARMVLKNALFFGRDKFSSLLIPWATYTHPEVAHVGLYESDLEERAIPFATYSRNLDDVDRAILEGDTEGFVKIHVKKGSDEILGATIVGSDAGNMISEIAVAMRAGMGLGTLASVIHPYPTVAEAIRQCGDAYNRTRLTPTVKKIFNRLMALQR